jgi:hypothetical protein
VTAAAGGRPAGGDRGPAEARTGKPFRLSGQAALAPKGVTLLEVAQTLDNVQAHWAGYLERVTDEDLEREFEYPSLDAGRSV